MYFVYNHTSVYYQKKGSGSSLLFLHGWGADSTVFNALISRYEKHYAVTTVDFPPFGLSDKLSCDYNVTDYKNLILALLNELKIEKTDIICHSFGGRVAIKLASENPKLIGRLIFCSSAGMPYKKSFLKSIKQIRYKILKQFVKAGIIKQNRLKKCFSSDYNSLPENMQKTFVNITKEILIKDAKNIKNPSLIIWGKEDKQTPLYMAKMLNECITNSILKVICGGHYGFLDSFNEFTAAADDFLGVV